MKKQITKNIQLTLHIINILIILYALITFIFKDKLYNLIHPLNVSFFMLITFFSILFLGFKKNKRNRDKIHIQNTYIVISTLYLITIYLTSNATGVYKNNIDIFNIICLLIYMIISEIERYILLNKANKKNNQTYFITFSYIILDILLISSFNNNIVLNNYFTIIIISIVRNLILSYTSQRFGYYPCFIYSLITFIFPFTLPIYPNLGNYLTIIFFIIYSLIIYYNISKPIRQEDEENYNKYKKGFSFYLERIFLVFVILIIFLVSGNFRYSISAIASDSMYPELKRGDAVILEKTNKSNINSLKKGMIVAFEEGGEIVTHRILTIELQEGKEYIITKGDNNDTKDVTKKAKDDIIGIVRFKIPLIGYPAVEISDIRNKEE